MKTGFSRRAVLRGIGQSAAIGSLAAILPRHLLAAQGTQQAKAAPAAAPMNICLSMLYPVGEGLAFDADAYRDRHMAVLRTAYAGGLERVELRVAPPPAEGMSPPPLLAAVSMWISDFAKFAAGANAHAKDVAASMATITKSAPLAQFDSIIAGLGGPRDSVPASSGCISYLFEAKEGATWDSKGFAGTYLPQLLAAYGPEAIRRVEAAEGVQSANGSKPLMLGTVNLYVADEAAYDKAAGSEAVKAIAGDAKQYFSSPPIQTYMKVHSVG